MEAIIPLNVQMQIDTTTDECGIYSNYAIETAQKYRDSAADLSFIKKKAKELDEARRELTVPLDESKKKIIALFKKPLDFLKAAEVSVKKAQVGWHIDQEEKRRTEEARLAKIQREEAERLKAKAEKEAARAESLKTEKGKDAAKAKAAATAAVVPTVESKVEKIPGISTRTSWKFRIVKEADIPREYMIPDEVYIGQIVRAGKGKKQIPGIEIYSEDIIASR